jgi:hypothetical protein
MAASAAAALKTSKNKASMARNENMAAAWRQNSGIGGVGKMTSRINHRWRRKWRHRGKRQRHRRHGGSGMAWRQLAAEKSGVGESSISGGNQA